MQLPDQLEFSCPVKLLYGRRALEHLPYEFGARNVRRPLLLSDEDAVRENRMRALTDALRASEIELGAVEPPDQGIDLDLVHELAAIYRDRDHDALLVMGGGALMDLAKLVNIVVSTGQDDPAGFGASNGIAQRLKPMALIAPAAASGGEASGHVTADRIERRSIHLMPDLAVIDERTVGAPDQKAVLNAGLTALAFGVEAMLGAKRNPMVDIYAANAVQMAMAALQSAAEMPVALTTRMLTASATVMAGCILAGKAPGKLHRLGTCLAATGRLSFPGALGVLLPAAVALETQKQGRTPARLLSALMGLERSSSIPVGRRSLLAAASLMSLLNNLYRHTEGRLPRNLGDAGFKSDDLTSISAAFAEEAGEEDPDAALVMLQHALNGKHDQSGC